VGEGSDGCQRRSYIRLTVMQCILVSGTHLGPWPNFYYCHMVVCLLMWGALSGVRTGPHHCINSQVQVPQDTWQYFTVSVSWLLQPLGSGPHTHIYIPPPRNGGAVTLSGTGFLLFAILGFPLYALDADSIEITTSDSFSIVVCVCCLATVVLFT
jgi:hypothetical protein